MSHQEFFETVQRQEEYMENMIEKYEHSDDAVVFSAFVRAQRKFGPALKTSNNPHFRSKYASLDAVIEAVIDGLHSEGFALTQYTEPRDDGVYVKTVLLHESGGLLVLGELFMPAVKHDPQGFGSALTYCRRYSIQAAMGIAPEDDDGNAASKQPAPRNSPTLGIFEQLKPERQAVIMDVVDAVNERFIAEDIIGAYDEYAGITDGDEKVALWSKLDSKVRSAIKKHGESLKGK
ncbi:MAG: ERF family protein [Fluviibacter sp.]